MHYYFTLLTRKILNKQMEKIKIGVKYMNEDERIEVATKK